MVILRASLGSRLTLTVAHSRRALAYLVPEDFLLSPRPKAWNRRWNPEDGSISGSSLQTQSASSWIEDKVGNQDYDEANKIEVRCEYRIQCAYAEQYAHWLPRSGAKAKSGPA